MNRDCMTGFADFLRGRDASPATVDSYLRDLKKFARWYAGTYGSDPEPGSVGPLDIAEFKRHLMNRGQKPATINRALASLSAFFKWAKDEGLASGDPIEGVKKLKEQKVAPRSLGRKEQMALMRAAQATGRVRDVAVMTLLLHTGLRVSEVCGLNLEDVHLGERSGEVTVRFGKGAKRRTVPLNSSARRALRAWLSERGEAPGPLFLSQKGGRLSRRAVEYLLSECGYRARLESVTPHVLRHTFCKNLVDSGESLDRVAVLAGHASLNTTARYTRPTVKDLRKAVDRLAWE